MALFATVRSGGLYLLDEPEAPLSPKRQIALIQLLMRRSRAGPPARPDERQLDLQVDDNYFCRSAPS